MADVLNETQVAQFQDAFSAVDTDNDGIIASKQLLQVLRSIGQNPTDTEVQDMINEVDCNGKGTFEFPAFLKMMARIISDLKAEDDIREAFQFFDSNGNGHISRFELKAVMMNLGEKLTDTECDALVREADLDGDGQIDYEEFYFLMASANKR